MTIQDAIEKAIEGGYKIQERVGGSKSQWELWYVQTQIFLDPSFWQSLGKTMGWDEEKRCIFCGNEVGKEMRGDGNEKYYWCPKEERGTALKKETWLYYWHRFIDHLAIGRAAEEFFEKLK